MKIKINSIDYSGSIVDGPGLRTVLFVQGCEKKCKGCHNQGAWDYSKGTEIDIDDLVEELNKKCLNKKLTISGGEPLHQYESLLVLLNKLQDYNLILYTGNEMEEVPKTILEYLDYIKVGRFIEEEKGSTIPYVGSKNQQFIRLKER
ncbi:MAG: Pyruvate formate-lyase 1-activating enzyme [Candidatus Heimdallarchaeota archaeon LC_3]|nr:MAG: Pyruvate formate-lyase 1-activating enzyme [Candidatus Heimdallarchaeota archaeon LC_3]